MAYPIVRPRSAHPISRNDIDPDALKVLYRLKSTGYRAYLVGGSVRDLLLRRRPKDFDVGTDARPEEVRSVFRNCRLIGRRFRLAHILFRGGKVVEVATFRTQPNPDEAEDAGADLLLRRDNTFGTPEEDALRRDFTVNGLFYDIADYAVIDYVGGLLDLDAGLIRSIGDPHRRYREDPVRMLRAVEFATRLSFAITPNDYEAILEHRGELVRSAPPRVLEEIAAMLRGGRALPTFLMLREMGLLDVIAPDLSEELRRPDPEHAGGAGHLFWVLLEVLDAERREGREMDDAVLFALLALPGFRSELGRLRSPDREAPSAIAAAADRTVAPLALRFAFPNVLGHRIRSILAFQSRLQAPAEWKASTRRLLFHADFAPALDVFDLRAMARGRDRDRVDEWRDLARRLRGGDAPAAVSRPRRRRRGARRPRGRPPAPENR